MLDSGGTDQHGWVHLLSAIPAPSQSCRCEDWWTYYDSAPLASRTPVPTSVLFLPTGLRMSA